MAKSLYAQGHTSEATTIAAIIISNNTTATLTIATELAALRDGDQSSFWDAAAGTLLGASLGGMRPSGGGVGAKGAASFPEGMSFNPSIKNHLSSFDGLTQKSGVSGTHNLDAFSQAASSNGIKILGETPTSVKGITNIEYQIPAYDRAGNVIGYKAKEFTKTVYDPKVFSDQKILDLGQQAAASGYRGALSKGVTQYDATAGGVSFRVYLDKATGAVTNFHPQ